MQEAFDRIANDVLQVADDLSAKLEAFWSLLSTTSSANNQNPVTSSEPHPGGNGHDDDLDDELMSSPLDGIAHGVIKDILQGQTHPLTPFEHFHAFRSAINWSEPFIWSLLLFQLVVFVSSVLVSRRRCGIRPRLAVMTLIAVMVRSGEYLNRLGYRNWPRFATQNYFDQQGIFILVFVSGPLLVDSLIMLINFMREAASLLVEVKVAKLKKQNQQQLPRKSEKENGHEDKKMK